MGTVKGQFIYACVIIVPLDHGSNKVFIECKPELDEPLGHVKASCVFSFLPSNGLLSTQSVEHNCGSPGK